MQERRWPLVLVAVVSALIAVAIGWAIGHSGSSSASEDQPSPMTKTVRGVAIGVSDTRSGALAASDNYVATASETFVQDPKSYERLVSEAYQPGYQATGLREAAKIRRGSPKAVDRYGQGAKSVAVVVARRLDSYDARRAATTSWVGAVTWGPGGVPGDVWSLVETSLAWDGDRWRVAKLDSAKRPAPAPSRVGYSSDAQLKTSTFDRELGGMTAPIYGGE